MIDLTGTENIAGFIRDLDLAMLELDQAISSKFEHWTKVIFEQLVETTPQWSGDLAAAWNYSINGIDESYTPLPNKIEHGRFWSMGDVFMRGDYPAVGLALSKAAKVHPTWRDVVYFHNPAPIAERAEAQTIMIRTVNLVDGRLAMIQYYVDKFNRGELQP